jgi:signal peptide peptidase SppA
MFLEAFWAMEPMALRALTSQSGKTREIVDWFDLPKSFADTPAGSPIDASTTDDAERAGLPVRRQGNIAVVTISGPLMKSPTYYSRYMGFRSMTEIRQAIQSADADEDVETILLVIDSPGGTVAGTYDLGQAVRATKKNTIAHVNDMAASAAYWIASQADKIHAGPGAVVGSIGVRMLLFDEHKSFEDMGIEAVAVDTGEFKSAGALGTKITEAHRKDFQRNIDSHFVHFEAAVRAGRANMSDQQWAASSDGRMFMDAEAMNLGLVDRIQTLDQTLAELQRPPPGRKTQASRGRVALRSSAL